MKLKNNLQLSLLLSIFLLITGSATLFCKKQNDSKKQEDGYFMRFKINGTPIEYKAQIEGTFDKATSLQRNTSLAGLKEAFVATKNNMTLLLATENNTQTNVDYTSYATTSSGMVKAKLVNLVYLDENGKKFLSWMEEFAPTLPPGTETKAVIRITEATAEYFKGSFGGVIYSEDFSTKLNITDGVFFARRFN